MPIDDSFWIVLPNDLLSLTAGELFEQVFPQDTSLQSAFRQQLDLDTNPDLTNMYDALVDIFARKRAGLCTVDTFQNDGRRSSDSTVVSDITDYDSTPPVLDLVLEQRFSAIDYAVRRGDFADVGEAMRWLQSRTLLHFLDADDYILSVEPLNEADAGLLPITQLLQESGDVQPAEETSLFEITDEGHETIQQMIADAENVLERYEVFADVLYDPETRESDFGTGRGEDLRVPVYEAEGVTPFRAVFHVELFDGTLARLEDDWRKVIYEREFFDVLLMPVVDRPIVDGEALERIVDAGFALMDEQTQETARQLREGQLRRTLKRD